MKTLKQEWLDRAKEAGVKDPDPNNRTCQAFAHFDGPGWTKFTMAALIIDLSEQLDKLEGDNDFYKEWNASQKSNQNDSKVQASSDKQQAASFKQQA